MGEDVTTPGDGQHGSILQELSWRPIYDYFLKLDNKAFLRTLIE
jgi:hypothetical protein